MALAVATAVGFLLADRLPQGATSVPCDDSWIHLSYARTFLETGRWALTAGAQSTTGTTGYLWAVLLAALMGLGLSPQMAALVPGAGCFVGVVWLWGRLVRRAGVAGPFDTISTCAVALSGNLLYLSASGMEAVATLFLAMLALDRQAVGDARGGGLAAAALAVTRPEGAALGGVLALVELTRRRKAGARASSRAVLMAAGRGMVPSAAGLALLMSLNTLVGGHAMPDTYQGRRWLANLPPGLQWSPAELAAGAVKYAREWWEDLRDNTYSLAFGDYLREGPGAVVDAHVAGLLAILSAAGLVRAATCGGLWPLTLYALVHNLAYAVLLPTPSAAGRYQPVNLLLASALPAVGAWALATWLSWWLRRRRPRASKPPDSLRTDRPFAVLAVLLLVPAAFNAGIWWRATRGTAFQLDRVHCEAGRWIAANLSPAARVAAFDFGALAYFGGREIVDFGGLTDAAAAKALHQARTLAYLHRRGATHLALPLPLNTPLKHMLAQFGLYARRGEPGPRARFEPLARFQVSQQHFWYAHLTGSAHPRMEVYRIVWE
ncbi:MAG: hypothetical protein HY814_04735 [Candidatus Riflebacteria bacterium]|nr:hypothetical protein [Candidatus Riflebacteria bacterium]